MLNAKCSTRKCLVTDITRPQLPPQVHDPQEFNPDSSMTSVTLRGGFSGIVFPRNVQHWAVRKKGESGYTRGEEGWLVHGIRIGEGGSRRSQESRARALSGGAERDSFSDQVADFCKIENGRDPY